MVVLALSAGAGVLASVPGAGAPQARRMFVTVTDANGTPVKDLSAADLVVRVEGRDATVISVTPAADPLSVVVVTEGFSRSLISDARATLRAIVTAVRAQHPDSRVGLMVGDGATAPSMRRVADQAADLDREVSRFFESSPNTPLLDGLLVATQTLAVESSRRRVILALVLGGSGDSTLTPVRIARAVREADAALWVIEIGGAGRTLGASEGRVLSEVSKASGGRHDSSSLAALASKARHAVEVIGAQYVVTFEAPVAGEVSMVGVRRSGLTVYAPAWAGSNLGRR